MTNLTLNEITSSLTHLYIFKGIQPSELADSIFEESYLNMISEKTLNTIEVILTFNEKCEITDKVYIHHMKYIYDKQSFLIKIEEAVNSKKFKTIWDRISLINSSLETLSKILKHSDYTDDQIQKIMNSVPKNFHSTRHQTLKIAS